MEFLSNKDAIKKMSQTKGREFKVKWWLYSPWVCVYELGCPASKLKGISWGQILAFGKGEWSSP